MAGTSLSKAHWEGIYHTKRVDEVSWYQPAAATSLALIRRAAPNPASAIIDIGGGASTLVDGLLTAGYRTVSVLDLSAAALAAAQKRLGTTGNGVRWIEADILDADLPPGSLDVWHDRACFHFLTEPDARARYVAQARRAVKPGGVIILGAFADDGPTRCSGLPVVRYTPAELLAEFGSRLDLVDAVREMHATPSGASQAFVYAVFRVTSR